MMCWLLLVPNRVKNRTENRVGSELVESNGGILVDRFLFMLTERDDQIIDGVEPGGVGGGEIANWPV